MKCTIIKDNNNVNSRLIKLFSANDIKSHQNTLGLSKADLSVWNVNTSTESVDRLPTLPVDIKI